MDDSFDREARDLVQKRASLQVPASHGAARSANLELSELTEGGSGPASASALIRIIEGEIIPRLYLAHRNGVLRHLS